jgi:DNA replication protein DnaC
MRRIIFITLLATITCQSSFCTEKKEKTEVCEKNTVEELFKHLKNEKNMIHLKIGNFTMFLANLLTDTKGVSNIEIFSLEECEKKTKDYFNEAIKNIKDKNYENVIYNSNNGERTRVLLKIKDNYVSEIIIISSGGDDPALVHIKGKIKQDDIKNVIKKNK